MPSRELKRQPGNGLSVGGVTLPLALAERGLIDEYEFIVHPRLAGHGPWLFEGLSKYIDLRSSSAATSSARVRWPCGTSHVPPEIRRGRDTSA